jgi:hypothetical protein
MPKMSLFKKVTAAIMIVLTSAIFAIPVVQASQPRDNDSNAILYGGAYTITELISKVNSGNTKGPHQTSAELKKLYSTVGMDFGWFGQLQSGTIYKDGHVTLNGKTVATRVQTMGRHYISGSTQDTRLPYPVYWRNPSVSFNSNSLPAWIFMNYDGTMGFGIVKSCGNPIKAAGVKVKPTPKFTLTIRKFDDRNGNRVKDTGESQLS